MSQDEKMESLETISRCEHEEILAVELGKQRAEMFAGLIEPVRQIASEVIYQTPSLTLDTRRKEYRLTLLIDDDKAAAAFDQGDRDVVDWLCGMIAMELVKFMGERISSEAARAARKTRRGGGGIVRPGDF